MTGLVERGLAVHRLSRLVTVDKLTEGARDGVVELAYDLAGRDAVERARDLAVRGGVRPELGDVPWSDVARRDPDAPKLAVLVTCPWCAAVWFAAADGVLGRTRWWPPVRRMLAVASVAGLAAGWETP